MTTSKTAFYFSSLVMAKKRFHKKKPQWNFFAYKQNLYFVYLHKHYNY